MSSRGGGRRHSVLIRCVMLMIELRGGWEVAKG